MALRDQRTEWLKVQIYRRMMPGERIETAARISEDALAIVRSSILDRNQRPASQHWRLLGPGYAIEWPDLDEHIGVEGLLAGRRSGESKKSLERWPASRGVHDN
jgi:hypothetical protein